MILDFSSFTRRGLLADLEHPAEIWWGQIADSRGRETGEETVEDRKITDLPVVRECCIKAGCLDTRSSLPAVMKWKF